MKMMPDHNNQATVSTMQTPYALMALFLSPWKDDVTIAGLAEAIQRSDMDWERLVHLANIHFCAPLWYHRAAQDGLLPLFPADLQAFLQHLNEANDERQQIFRNAAVEMVSKCHDADIPAMLLKGAATFCDDLYGNLGARMMGDIDMLVREEDLNGVKGLLSSSGYTEEEDCFSKKPQFFGSNAPHHLPRYSKPGTPVVFEIHFRTSQGQADRVLPTPLCWATRKQEHWEGATCFVLHPTLRLLHNAVHAMVPKAMYVKTSIIPLNHLSEFVHLAYRYSSEVDWRTWLDHGARQGMKGHLRVYLATANRLMGMPFPETIRRPPFAGIHTARISAAANINAAKDFPGGDSPDMNTAERVKNIAVRGYIVLFRWIHWRLWLWYNLCYKIGLQHIPTRLFCLFFSLYERKGMKIIDFELISRRIRKIFLLLKGPKSR